MKVKLRGVKLKLWNVKSVHSHFKLSQFVAHVLHFTIEAYSIVLTSHFEVWRSEREEFPKLGSVMIKEHDLWNMKFKLPSVKLEPWNVKKCGLRSVKFVHLTLPTFPIRSLYSTFHASYSVLIVLTSHFPVYALHFTSSSPSFSLLKVWSVTWRLKRECEV